MNLETAVIVCAKRILETGPTTKPKVLECIWLEDEENPDEYEAHLFLHANLGVTHFKNRWVEPGTIVRTELYKGDSLGAATQTKEIKKFTVNLQTSKIEELSLDD